MRAYHNSQLEMKSDMRDEAAALRNQMGDGYVYTYMHPVNHNIYLSVWCMSVKYHVYMDYG